MQEKLRIFTLSKDDFSLINPNTKTCPVFRTNKDADLTIKVLKRVGVFVNEANNINPWGAFYIRLVDLGDHQDEIELVHLRDDKIHIYPIYEAKLFWQMDHRFSTFSRMSDDDFVNGNARQCEVEEKENPLTRVVTRYYATGKLYSELINKYPDYRKSFFIVWRDISNSTNERSSIASIISKTLATRSCPGIGFNINHPAYLLISNLNSIVYDYFVRQKISGVHFNWGLLKQTSVLAPLEYAKDYKNRICASSIELIYSSWDIKAFADDVWKNADEEIRKLIRRQWEKNKVTTGGHEWDPPEWCEIDKDGCPLPPFKWDEDRRAVLKAELDAIYAKLYGLTTDELRYILDPQDVYGPDFPGETFRVLKEKEIRNYGEYRTKRLVMEAWEKLNNSII
jgi:hypothetical protein